jgi:hypothetical protein
VLTTALLAETGDDQRADAPALDPAAILAGEIATATAPTRRAALIRRTGRRIGVLI